MSSDRNKSVQDSHLDYGRIPISSRPYSSYELSYGRMGSRDLIGGGLGLSSTSGNLRKYVDSKPLNGNTAPDPRLGNGRYKERGENGELGDSYLRQSYQDKLDQTQMGSMSLSSPTQMMNIFQMAADVVAKKFEERLAPINSNLFGSNSTSTNSVSYLRNFSSDKGGGSVSSSSGRTELVTGVVTQIGDNFGMISDQVFFMLNVVVGPMPKFGDKVAVVAYPVEGMPFRFNSKRVQVVSKDFGLSSSNSGLSVSYVPTETDPEFDIDFGPLPEMPSSLNLKIKKRSPSPKGRRKKPHGKKSKTKEPKDKHISKSKSSQSSSLTSNKHSVSKRRPNSRSRKGSTRTSWSKSPRSKPSSGSRARSPHGAVRRSTSRSRARIRRSNSVEIISETDTTNKQSPLIINATEERKAIRAPRSVAALIRHITTTPPPLEDRFLPNPLAKKGVPPPLPVCNKGCPSTQNSADFRSPLKIESPTKSFTKQIEIMDKMEDSEIKARVDSLNKFLKENNMGEQRKQLILERKRDLEDELKRRKKKKQSSRPKYRERGRMPSAERALLRREKEIRRVEEERMRRGSERPVKRVRLEAIRRSPLVLTSIRNGKRSSKSKSRSHSPERSSTRDQRHSLQNSGAKLSKVDKTKSS